MSVGRRASMRSVDRGRTLVLLLLGICLFVRPAPARAEDDILTIGKSALYGAATGLLLGAATALVVDSGDRDDAIRWGIVIGTFGGFGYGVYKVSREEDEDDFFGALRDGRAPWAGFGNDAPSSLRTLPRPPRDLALAWSRTVEPRLVFEPIPEHISTEPPVRTGERGETAVASGPIRARTDP